MYLRYFDIIYIISVHLNHVTITHRLERAVAISLTTHIRYRYEIWYCLQVIVAAHRGCDEQLLDDVGAARISRFAEADMYWPILYKKT